MSDHDPLCAARAIDDDNLKALYCNCLYVAAIRADERAKAAERIAKGVRHTYDCPGLDDWNACDCGMKLMYDLAAARGDGAE